MMVDKDNKEVENPDFKSRKICDQLVLSLINSLLSEGAMSEVLGITTSRDVWKTLDEIFSQKSMTREIQLKYELQTMKKGSKTVGKFVRKFKSACDQLAVMGSHISEMDKVHWFLRSLGSDYSTFSISLMSLTSLPSLREVVPKAVSHDLFIKSLNDQSTHDVAFTAQRGGGRSGPGGRYNRGRFGRGGGQNNLSQPISYGYRNHYNRGSFMKGSRFTSNERHRAPPSNNQRTGSQNIFTFGAVCQLCVKGGYGAIARRWNGLPIAVICGCVRGHNLLVHELQAVLGGESNIAVDGFAKLFTEYGHSAFLSDEISDDMERIIDEDARVKVGAHVEDGGEVQVTGGSQIQSESAQAALRAQPTLPIDCDANIDSVRGNCESSFGRNCEGEAAVNNEEVTLLILVCSGASSSIERG
ncbi:hypothetical protein GIB67_016621 [Kingdonia uniflora]|uniref:Uncharacterized protein n=1 Tax=Kingdonia uniflora TaxID=39325 RepID=A0A7J7MZ41_9MAGN|nr:hypothetical protein GIB67_016621 [Kingdonia uniflora]